MTQAEVFTFTLPYPQMPDRRVRVYVPAHREGETLPVIYMTDGQNLFDPPPDAWGCWNVTDAVEQEQQNGAVGAIIVAIDHGGSHRDSELTPATIGEIVRTGELGEFTPLGEEFDAFVMQSVKPYVEAHFPVKTGRRYTALCGSSSGGLQVTFTGLLHKESFGAVGAFSPAFLLYRAEDMCDWIMRQTGGDVPYLYLYTGAGDRMENDIYQNTDEIYDRLLELGYPCELLNEVVMLTYRHQESAWEEIFRDFLHTFLTRAGV